MVNENRLNDCKFNISDLNGVEGTIFVNKEDECDYNEETITTTTVTMFVRKDNGDVYIIDSKSTKRAMG